jgi:MoaA/NifB/PqqE/SkfB family radical SAM enzyme
MTATPATTGPTDFFLNLNFVCNERCVFCAADLADGAIRTRGRPRGLTMEDVEHFLRGRVPGPGDRVLVAGGEPTLHPHLGDVLRLVSGGGAEVVVFTNGLALADESTARSTVEAGATCIQIALFGSTAARHDAVTRRPGSFETSIAAIRTLCRLRDGPGAPPFTIVGRVLVSRDLVDDNPAIVSVFASRAPDIDAISLNRLILSDAAEAVGAPVSWADARASVNECARRIRAAGIELHHAAIPLCVFDGDNARHVAEAAARRLDGPPADLAPRNHEYIDPLTAIETTEAPEPTRRAAESAHAPLALPNVCVACDYLPVCGRIERWYFERYGIAGLRSVRRPARARSIPLVPAR